MGVEPVRLRGREDGGSAVEAALLMAAMTLVLLPILYALGKTAGSTFDSPCDALAGQTCKEAGEGSGGYSGAIARGQSSRTSERWVQANWTGSDGSTSAERVECPPLESSPEPEQTIECTVIEPGGGEETVRVKVTKPNNYSWAD
jgi:Flp pilus assembly pilin Flp